MLHLLASREQGVDSNIRLERAEATRRALLLDLSSFKDVQQVFDSAINCIDLDQTEER